MSERGPVLSALGAVGGVIAAASCCLPLPAILVATGIAGASVWLDAARPYLIGLSLALLAYGFWRARSCSRRSRAVVWIAGLLMVAFFAAPQWIANALAGGRIGSIAAPELSALTDLRSAFNAESGHTRLVVFLSPT